MPVIPSKDLDAVQFFETHTPIWIANAAAIGVLPATLTAFDVLVKDARAAYDSQQAARAAAKNSTVAWHDAVAAMRGSGGDVIATIKAFAQTTGDPTVYTTAQIPPPAPPSPAPPPGQPNNISVGLEPSGAVTLRWRSTNAAPSAGTFFSVRRKLPGQAGFSLIGNTGGKVFTDDTLTQGTTGATYIIRGHRGTLSGPESQQLTIQFGVGGMTVSGGTLALAA